MVKKKAGSSFAYEAMSAAGVVAGAVPYTGFVELESALAGGHSDHVLVALAAVYI